MNIPPGFHAIEVESGFSAANGPWFEKIEDGRLVRGFRPGLQHSNTHGIVHGGMLAAFLDSAMGSLVWTAIDRRCVTLRLTLDYMVPARVGDWLEAAGEVVAHDDNVAQVRARLYGPRHDVLAGHGVFALLRARRPIRARIAKVGG